MQTVLETKSLTKVFGAFTALGGVNIQVFPGEVHALLGDNGAGKSTLIKMLSGIFPQTSGEIIFDTKTVNFRSPHDASQVGIGTVYQDLALAPLLSIARNFFLGRELTKGPKFLGILDDAKMKKIALEEMRKIGIDAQDPDQPVGTMSGGQRQTLAIAACHLFWCQSFDLG